MKRLILFLGALFPISLMASGLEVKSVNGTSGHLTINDSGTIEGSDNNVSSMSFDVKDNSINEVRLKISNSPVNGYFLKSGGADIMQWAIATNTITASPTITSTNLNVLTTSNPSANNFNLTVLPLAPQYNAIQWQGTAVSNASPTALYRIPRYNTGTSNVQWMNLLAGTGISFSESSVNGSATLQVSATSTATNTVYLFHSDKSPTNDGFGGVVDADKNSVYLDASTNHGVDWGDVFVPNTWNGSSDLIPRFTVFTPTGAAAATVTLQLRAQIIKAGSSYWGPSSYTIFATASFLLANNALIQTLEKSSFRVPAASMTAGCFVHVQYYRIPGAAADTHTADLHFDSAVDKITSN